MDALNRIHGWSPALISQAILMFWLASLPGTLSVGVVVDRYGPVPVILVGGCCIGSGLVALSALTASWQLYVVYAFLGFGYPALAGAAISATLAPWFGRGFGTALAIALSGASLGGALIPFSIIYLARDYGFETTVAGLGGLLIVTILYAAAALAWIGRPRIACADRTHSARFDFKTVLALPRFWGIALAAGIGLGGQVGLLAHQVPIIAAISNQQTAALMVTVVAIASAIGRLLVGWLTRRVPVTHLAAISYAVHGSGIALLALADGLPAIVIGSAVAGLGVGPIVMLPPIIVREAFGISHFGRIFAMTNVIMYVVAALSPWSVGLILTQTNAYPPGLWMLVGMEIVATVLVLRVLKNVGPNDMAPAREQ